MLLACPVSTTKHPQINCWLCTRCMLRLFPLKKYHDETATTSSSNRIISARLISSIGLALSLGRRGAQGRSLKPCCDVVRRRRGANNSSQIAPQRVFGRGLLPAAIVTRIVASVGGGGAVRACLPAASTHQMRPRAVRGGLLDVLIQSFITKLRMPPAVTLTPNSHGALAPRRTQRS
jgi:hypothetical protein